jgi:hypothetical protein
VLGGGASGERLGTVGFSLQLWMSGGGVGGLDYGGSGQTQGRGSCPGLALSLSVPSPP